MLLLQRDLYEVLRQWNVHRIRIRPSAGSLYPPDASDQPYFLPEAPAFDCVFQRQVTISQQIFDQLQ